MEMTLGTWQIAINRVQPSQQELTKMYDSLGEAGLKSKMHHRSAQNLGFADSVFDLAMGAHLIEHVSNPQAVIQEMVRVLRPGSPLLLIVSQPGLYTVLIQWRWRYTAYKPQTVMQMMSETGLVDLTVYTLNSGVPNRTSLAYIGNKNSSK